MGDDSSKKVADLTSTVVLSDDEPEADNPFEHTVELSNETPAEAPGSAPALPFSKAPKPPSASPDASNAPLPGAPWSETDGERKVPAPSADFTGTLAVPPEALKDQVAAARQAADELEAKRTAAAPEAQEPQEPQPNEPAEAAAPVASERPEGVGYDPTGGELAPPSVSAEERRKKEEERRRREAKSFRASVYAGVGPRRRRD